MWLPLGALEKVLTIDATIEALSPEAHMWLTSHPLEKQTMYKDGGRRWEAMTTNVAYMPFIKPNKRGCNQSKY